MYGGDEAKEKWTETARAEGAEESRTQEKDGRDAVAPKACLRIVVTASLEVG